jgi:hypothetical protein
MTQATKPSGDEDREGSYEIKNSLFLSSSLVPQWICPEERAKKTRRKTSPYFVPTSTQNPCAAVDEEKKNAHTSRPGPKRPFRRCTKPLRTPKA